MNDNVAGREPQNQLRTAFVGMLFAIVVATFAVKISEVLYVLTDGWRSGLGVNYLLDRVLSDDKVLLVPLSHLVLAFVMVAMSWVMWSQSQAKGHKDPISSFMSPQFILLLIEVFLVVLYFSLVSTTGQDIDGFRVTGDLKSFIPAPSAVPAAPILVLIFLTFSFWDFLADVIASDRVGWKEEGFLRSVNAMIQGVVVYCSVSIFCMLLCIIVMHSSNESYDPINVFYANMALLSIVIWFKPAKRLEYYFCILFPNERLRENTRRGGEEGFGGVVKITLPLFAFIIFLCLSK